jgi:hypothetical protein
MYRISERAQPLSRSWNSSKSFKILSTICNLYHSFKFVFLSILLFFVVKNLNEVSPLCGLMNIPAKITLTFIKDFTNSALIRLEKILKDFFKNIFGSFYAKFVIMPVFIRFLKQDSTSCQINLLLVLFFSFFFQYKFKFCKILF